MATNPTLDVDDYSREIVQETVRPGVEDYLDAATGWDDPVDRSGSKTPPLVVTALPGGGGAQYPHVVVAEASDSAGPIDARREFSQHDFAIRAELHGRTTTEMFRLRGLVRGYFIGRRDELRDAGFAIEGSEAISGNLASWDATAKTSTWELTVTGLLHTHPDADT